MALTQTLTTLITMITQKMVSSSQLPSWSLEHYPWWEDNSSGSILLLKFTLWQRLVGVVKQQRWDLHSQVPHRCCLSSLLTASLPEDVDNTSSDLETSASCRSDFNQLGAGDDHSSGSCWAPTIPTASWRWATSRRGFTHCLPPPPQPPFMSPTLPLQCVEMLLQHPLIDNCYYCQIISECRATGKFHTLLCPLSIRTLCGLSYLDGPCARRCSLHCSTTGAFT